MNLANANKMGLLRIIVFGVLFAFLLKQYFYEELPHGFSEPGSVKLFSVPLKICFDMSIIGHTLGLNGGIMKRSCMNFFAKLTPLISSFKSKHTDLEFDGIPVRMFAPESTSSDPKRSIIFFHGGGWVAGSVDTHSGVTDKIAYELGVTVFSVEYRQPPDYIFPGAFEDCVKATKAIVRDAKTYNIDVHRVALMGDSAGGNLAAAVSIKLRDDNFKPMPKLQVLVYPALQMLNLDTPSYQYNQDTLNLKRRWCIECMQYYLFGHWNFIDIFNRNEQAPPALRKTLAESYMNLKHLPNDIIKSSYHQNQADTGNEQFWKEYDQLLRNPYLNPLVAESLRGLPQVYLTSCKYDVLRDDSFFYENRLVAANISVEHKQLTNCLHGWINGINLVPSFNEYFLDMLRSINRSL